MNHDRDHHRPARRAIAYRRTSSLYRAAALGLAFAAGAARAGEGADCKPLSWAAEPAPGYELKSCDHKDWAPFNVTVGSASKEVQGQVESVTYELTDETKNLTNDAARERFTALGKKAGGVLASAAGEGWNASLRHKTPKGDEWFHYEHGGGNEATTSSFTLTTVRPAALQQEVEARATVAAWDLTAEPCKDPPWLVRQFSYFKRAECAESDFDQLTVETAQGPVTLAGHFYRVTYVLADENRNPVPFVVWKNYVDALQAIGAKLVSSPEDHNQALLTRKTPQGELSYLYRHENGNEMNTTSYSLLYVQAGGPPVKACTLQVHGVNFDFDKATLRPDSTPVLEQVLALFKADPAYAAEIAGHTDNVGDKAYNRKLSAQRAGAVKDWLVAHGIAAARLTSGGYGDTQPIVPNDSDEHRARNRRVELKRTGCKPSHAG